MNKIATDVLIVGGGPAGISSALAASSNRDTNVTIVDDNPHLGGQIWRSELGKTKSSEAEKLINEIETKRIKLINNAQVFDSGETVILAEVDGERLEIEYKKLILATGARERFLPFPGWTLPGVFGAGGLQALLKGGLNIKDKRVVVAGTGPLLLAVADNLAAHGANVLMIAEQTPAAKVRRFARGLWRLPSKMVEAAALRARLVGIPYRTDCWITEAHGNGKLDEISYVHRGGIRTLDCDYLACGFHLVPNTELASLLNCKIEDGYVVVDEFQQTTREGTFCAGEPTGIGGLEASLVEGKIAGLVATGDHTGARNHFSDRDSTRRFAERLNHAFALRNELKNLADDNTFVCRCEDVTYSRIREFPNWREAKLQTRCGMGACQGRVCGPATEFLFGWKTGAVRPPIFPVKLENL